MSTRLSTEQLYYIEYKLATLGLHSPELQQELLDHLSCLIENHIAQGQSFAEASNMAFATFEKDEIQDLNETIISLHKKTSFMKIFVLSCTLLTLSIATFFHLNHLEKEPTTIHVVESLLPDLPIIDPPSIHPVPGHLKQTAGFGMFMHPFKKVKQMHRGIDIVAPLGTPIVATADGIVTTATNKEAGYGLHIVIQHDDFYSTFYAHLSKLLVMDGQEVKKGNVIGLVGSTGLSTGPHLHYEVRKDEEKVDPKPYLQP